MLVSPPGFQVTGDLVAFYWGGYLYHLLGDSRIFYQEIAIWVYFNVLVQYSLA